MRFATVVEASQEILAEWLEVAKQILIDDLDVHGRNATGRTKAAIKVVNTTPSAGQVVGPEHVLYTFQGRAPGKMPPLSKIIDWCVARNIPRNRAWIIAKRISEAGTRLFREGAASNNALLKATSKERIDQLQAELGKTYSLALQTDLRDVINR
ncbi:hypothetical protein [Pedobacter sp. SYSU D00535]|uniref:hypothetical protein n=1 Tax=Pedobacter sp. SYSU D00535 TaxID=2810308 RepID=UPI001A977C9E|nr:hypothetical protein [Pedobacter sp. SYSU D00535]